MKLFFTLLFAFLVVPLVLCYRKTRPAGSGHRLDWLWLVLPAGAFVWWWVLRRVGF